MYTKFRSRSTTVSRVHSRPGKLYRPREAIMWLGKASRIKPSVMVAAALRASRRKLIVESKQKQHLAAALNCCYPGFNTSAHPGDFLARDIQRIHLRPATQLLYCFSKLAISPFIDRVFLIGSSLRRSSKYFLVKISLHHTTKCRRRSKVTRHSLDWLNRTPKTRNSST
jgi:hypothetical protein